MFFLFEFHLSVEVAIVTSMEARLQWQFDGWKAPIGRLQVSSFLPSCFEDVSDVVDVLLLLMMIMLVMMKMLESLLIMITVMMMMTTSFHLLLSLWCNDDEDNKQKHIFFFWWRSWWSTSQVLPGATNWRFADIVSNLLQPVQKYSFLHLLIIFWYLFLNLPMSYPTFQHPSKNIFFCICFQLGYQVTRFFDPVSVSIRYLSTKKSATAGCDKYQLLL